MRNGFADSLLSRHYEPLDVTKGVDFRALGVGD